MLRSRQGARLSRMLMAMRPVTLCVYAGPHQVCRPVRLLARPMTEHILLGGSSIEYCTERPSSLGGSVIAALTMLPAPHWETRGSDVLRWLQPKC